MRHEKPTDAELTDAVRTILRRADYAMKPSDISLAVGYDIGTYANILGPLEANGEIERVSSEVRWKPERFEVVSGEPLG